MLTRRILLTTKWSSRLSAIARSGIACPPCNIPCKPVDLAYSRGSLIGHSLLFRLAGAAGRIEQFQLNRIVPASPNPNNAMRVPHFQ
jgi:hypothetical protein